MQEVIKQIQSLTDYELREVMHTIEKQFAIFHPDWDVIYIAVHKDPEKRKTELKQILEMLCSRTEACPEILPDIAHQN